MSNGIFDDLVPIGDGTQSGPGGTNAQAEQQRWEDKVVSRILKRFDLGDVQTELRKQAADVRDSRCILFQDFLERFPRFPVYVASAVVKHVAKVTTTDLFNRFTLTPIYREYMDAEPAIPSAFHGDGYVMAFPWPRVLPMACVGENYNASPDSEALFFRHLRDTTPGRKVYVRDFESFLKSLRWSPDG